MYSLSYILHIIGIAVWIGSFSVLGYLLRILAKDETKLDQYTLIIKKTQKWVMWGVIPSLIIILNTGAYMILQFNRDSLPLYLTLMEQAGTLVILISIIFVSIYSVRLTKRFKNIPLKKERTLSTLTKTYANFLFVSTALGTIIVIIVGLRLV